MSRHRRRHMLGPWTVDGLRVRYYPNGMLFVTRHMHERVSPGGAIFMRALLDLSRLGPVSREALERELNGRREAFYDARGEARAKFQRLGIELLCDKYPGAELYRLRRVAA